MTKCDFSFRHYESILKTSKRKGFKFSSFTQKDKTGKIVYLRHDIDVSVGQALKIAEIDHKNKISSTFFVRNHSNFYNPVSEQSQKIIKKIFSLGHKIGLHYDGEIHIKNIENLIDQEYSFLKKFIPLEKVVSFHRPRTEVFGLELKGFISTYNSYFFQKCEYISDSNRELKKGCITEFLEKTAASKIQILTHPIWWNEKSLNLRQTYQKLLKETEADFTEELKVNIKNYQKLL